MDRLDRETPIFLDELDKAYAGYDTNFAFAQNNVAVESGVVEGEVFQVIMIGGSHGEKSLFKKADGKAVMRTFGEFDLPTLASKKVFLDVLANQIDTTVSHIIINFAYPLKPIKRGDVLDGILLKGTKEHAFEGVVGLCVGELVESFVAEAYSREISVQVCNDTVALGLAARAEYGLSAVMAGVVGTGFNMGVWVSPDVFVNIESGNFSSFIQTSTGKIVDEASQNTGQQLLEKEVSGAYLCEHFNLLAKEQNISVRVQSTQELSLLANGNSIESRLAQSVFISAGEFVAMTLYAVYLFAQKHNFGQFPYVAVMEGSLFWKGWNVKEHVEILLAQHGVSSTDLAITYIRYAGLQGAASLAL